MLGDVGCREQLFPGYCSRHSTILSLVVLLEAALGNRDWKEIAKEELQALRAEVRVGEREAAVTDDHVVGATRRLNASGWSTGPVIEFHEEEFVPPDDKYETEPADE